MALKRRKILRHSAVALGSGVSLFAVWARCHPPIERERTGSLPRHEIARAISENGAIDSRRVLQLALSEPDPISRQTLVLKTLRAWARRDPFGAAAWASSRPFNERTDDISSILEAVATHSEVAIAVAKEAIERDPELAHDHGCSLIFALSHTDNIGAAVEFAREASSSLRTAWLETAYEVWAEKAPVDAATDALTLPNQMERQSTFRDIMARWSSQDPQSALSFAQNVVDLSERSVVIQIALPDLARSSPAQAADWMSRQPFSPELDSGMIAIALSPEMVALNPKTALEWAEAVSQVDLRSNTIASVLEAWMSHDGSAALEAMKSCHDLNRADREMLISSAEQFVADQSAETTQNKSVR